jgi:hypothetical protein
MSEQAPSNDQLAELIAELEHAAEVYGRSGGQSAKWDVRAARDALLAACSSGEPPADEASVQRRLQAYPKLSEFFSKYAIGPKLPPSCFVCGQIVIEPAVTHAELPGIICCKRCKDAADRAAQPPVPEWLPIETAPKDGRSFLAVRSGSPFICRWGSGANIWQQDSGEWRDPKYWMPLPSRPTKRPEYCKCSFTDDDGTVVPGEPCSIHPGGAS